jgi:hypothetical protein
VVRRRPMRGGPVRGVVHGRRARPRRRGPRRAGLRRGRRLRRGRWRGRRGRRPGHRRRRWGWRRGWRRGARRRLRYRFRRWLRRRGAGPGTAHDAVTGDDDGTATTARAAVDGGVRAVARRGERRGPRGRAAQPGGHQHREHPCDQGGAGPLRSMHDGDHDGEHGRETRRTRPSGRRILRSCGGGDLRVYGPPCRPHGSESRRRVEHRAPRPRTHGHASSRTGSRNTPVISGS